MEITIQGSGFRGYTKESLPENFRLLCMPEGFDNESPPTEVKEALGFRVFWVCRV